MPGRPLTAKEAHRHVAAIVHAALAAADPSECVRRVIAVSMGPSPCSVLAIGKAAAKMHAAFTESAGPPAGSLVIVPHGTEAGPDAMRAGHPLPDSASLYAAERVERFASQSAARGLPLTLLLSGGASALIAAPADGITISDYAGVTAELMRAGADIAALNTVRRHIDRLKGGKLALLLPPIPVRALVLSDVIG